MSVRVLTSWQEDAPAAEVPGWPVAAGDDRGVTRRCGCKTETFFPVRCEERRELEAALLAALGRKDTAEARFVAERIARHERRGTDA